MEEARRGRHAHQRGDLRSAARLAVDHHPIRDLRRSWRYSPEPTSTQRQDPSSRHSLSPHKPTPPISARIEEAEDIEPVIHRDLHDVMVPRHLRALVRRPVRTMIRSCIRRRGCRTSPARFPVRLGVQMLSLSISSLCQPSSQSCKKVCSRLVQG